LEALRTLLIHDPPAARDAVNELSALARRGLEETRQAIQALRSEHVETLGLSGALRDSLQAFQARTGIEASLSVAGQDPELTAGESQTLLRIAEEALSNVERHAAAQHVTVRLDSGQDRVELVIRDDGLGFDSAKVQPDRYGLTGMQERAALVGARLLVHSASHSAALRDYALRDSMSSRPDSGTEVRCTLER
jgi:signal transduction histidine kinase